jgi:hypothetical protein
MNHQSPSIRKTLFHDLATNSAYSSPKLSRQVSPFLNAVKTPSPSRSPVHKTTKKSIKNLHGTPIKYAGSLHASPLASCSSPRKLNCPSPQKVKLDKETIGPIGISPAQRKFTKTTGKTVKKAYFVYFFSMIASFLADKQWI